MRCEARQRQRAPAPAAWRSHAWNASGGILSRDEEILRLAERARELETGLGQVHGWMDWNLPADLGNARRDRPRDRSIRGKADTVVVDPNGDLEAYAKGFAVKNLKG